MEREPKIEFDPNAAGDERALQQFGLGVEKLLAAEKEQKVTPQENSKEQKPILSTT